MLENQTGTTEPLQVLMPANGERPRLTLVKRRPEVRGKFIFLGEEKLYLRGVTYGTFRPDPSGHEFPTRQTVEADFAQMSANGINALRVYTPPPRWLLDLAEQHGLWVMVGLPVERSASFLDYDKCELCIEETVREEVRACGGHPAVLCYSIGNEIPASIVRWQGRRKVERFLERLYRVVKQEDPQALVTYVNYPSTEYLRLPFLDFLSFNVYLEDQQRLQDYLARLQTTASERPLVMAELGLDSLRHGEQKQAEVLDWQVRTSFAAGCAGVFVYAWTDQWYRGGAEVYDWKFGITSRQRRPKRALAAVRAAFRAVPFPPSLRWPKISVIICTHNGSRTIRDTCQSLQNLDYPDYEVIVVDDGSKDSTPSIVREFGFRLLSTSSLGLSSALPGRENGHDWIITRANRGLSNARNVGLAAASGDIVAYIDDDAYPDAHWLRYLAASFMDPRNENHAGVGGPNIAPYADGLIAECVAHAPGGPIHVLLTNREAEHIPGCNMAFRKVALKSIGGFDPQFHVAGDDVDVCWRLQKDGWTLGFSPAALVWHHRRNSIRAYWKQQKGYGKAEAMLERKWPEKYNLAGHARWSGRVYTNGLTYMGWKTRRIYHGQWGTAPFQSLYEPAPGGIESLPMMPEWYLILVALAALSTLGAVWHPLLLCLPLLAGCLGVSIAQAARCAAGARFARPSSSKWETCKRRILITGLFLSQPLARLVGRVQHGLIFWRRSTDAGWTFPRPWLADLWSRQSNSIEERLEWIEKTLRKYGCVPQRGGDFDRWDLEVSCGILGSARLRMAAEPHGSGLQLLRIVCQPRCSALSLAFGTLFGGLACAAAFDQAWSVHLVLAGAALLIFTRTMRECGNATAAFLAVVRKIERVNKNELSGKSASP
ncbi:MAG TPA: glycosyltransferase [Candidatus Limnocylindrales bacterium]|nr:glycosyltransferase [Candidatus Limnocylindrales bacterium]